MSKLIPIPKISSDTAQRLQAGPLEMYVEWWKLGTPASDINCGIFNTVNIRHFCKIFGQHKNLSMIFLRREIDKKVLYNRRIN